MPNLWRKRLKDGVGSSEPGDELILATDINILSEAKRTAGDRFKLAFIRAPQLKGLRDFDEVIPRNYGLVFVSFQTLDMSIDDAYAFRFLTGIRFMRSKGREYITLNEFRTGAVYSARLPRIYIDKEPAYDLTEVLECYKLL